MVTRTVSPCPSLVSRAHGPGRVGVWVPGPPPLRLCPGSQHIPIGDRGARNPLRSLPHLPAASQALGDGTTVAMATCSCGVTSQPAASAQGEKPWGLPGPAAKGAGKPPGRGGARAPSPGSRRPHPFQVEVGRSCPPGWPVEGRSADPAWSLDLPLQEEGWSPPPGPGAVWLCVSAPAPCIPPAPAVHAPPAGSTARWGFPTASRSQGLRRQLLGQEGSHVSRGLAHLSHPLRSPQQLPWAWGCHGGELEGSVWAPPRCPTCCARGPAGVPTPVHACTRSRVAPRRHADPAARVHPGLARPHAGRGHCPYSVRPRTWGPPFPFSPPLQSTTLRGRRPGRFPQIPVKTAEAQRKTVTSPRSRSPRKVPELVRRGGQEAIENPEHSLPAEPCPAPCTGRRQLHRARVAAPGISCL